VVDALSAVTETGGTGTKAVVDGYSVAGKTGTAQTVDPVTGRYSRSRYIASFIGFATQVEPRVVVFAALDSPKGIYYASETAAPLFRNVLKAVVNRFSMPSDPKLVHHQPSPVATSDLTPLAQAHPEIPVVTAPAVAPRGAADSQSISMPIITSLEAGDSRALWKMPTLIGLSSREALRALQGRPFEIAIEGRGVVRTQFPEAGNPVADKTTIRLSLSAP
jgi:cell division protein FtsI (penicillin-binding protein 3)